jgi:hypothetical protein
MVAIVVVDVNDVSSESALEGPSGEAGDGFSDNSSEIWRCYWSHKC